VLDLSRSKSELVLENALLRRQVKRPALTWHDRALFVLIASKLATWKTALMIVQPDTLLRWHRDLFRRVWRHKSRRKGKKGREPLAENIVRLIKNMAKDNRTWGAERIRFGVSRTPDDGCVAQQLREATPYGQGPRFLIRDNDNKYGAAFDRVAEGTDIDVLTTPYEAPQANAVCERFLGSVRRECLDLLPNPVRPHPQRGASPRS
jgi:hypothetical protein